MKHEDFSIGIEFYTGTGKWRCTDIGTRTIVAMQLDRVIVVSRDSSNQTSYESVTDDQSWFNGPPYAVEQCVFDEFDISGCSLESGVFDVEVND